MQIEFGQLVNAIKYSKVIYLNGDLYPIGLIVGLRCGGTRYFSDLRTIEVSKVLCLTFNPKSNKFCRYVVSDSSLISYKGLYLIQASPYFTLKIT